MLVIHFSIEPDRRKSDLWLFCQVGCALRKQDNLVNGKVLTQSDIEEKENWDKYYDKEWYTAKTIGLSDMQLKIIKKFVKDVRMNNEYGTDQLGVCTYIENFSDLRIFFQ